MNSVNMPQIVPAVTHEDAGQRLDNFLLKRYSSIPKSHLYKMIRKGEVRVNSKRIAVHHRLIAGDKLRLPPKLLHQPEQTGIKAHYPRNLVGYLENNILYEDEDLIIVNKPNSLAVHAGSSVSYGLIEVLKDAWTQWPGLELVHRLDKDTSGCIMLAKRRQSLVRLQDLLKKKQIKKYYYAVIEGKWRGGKTVNAPLARQPLGTFKERFVKVEATGDAATTHFSVMKSFEEATFVEAQPVTGRTHQIRVHAAFMGSPIIGDSKYGHKATNQDWKKQGFGRLYLHAHKLIIPLNEDPIVVSAPIPKDFSDFLEYLSKD